MRLALVTLVLVVAVAATADAAVLTGFGAAPARGDGPVAAGERVTFSIRATGEAASEYVVSVNGEEVARGSAADGVTEGDFRMPAVEGSREAVTVGVVLDDPDSEPRTVSLAYARPAPEPVAEPAPQRVEDPAPAGDGGAAPPPPAATPQPAPARPAESPSTGVRGGSGGAPERPARPAARTPERGGPGRRDRPARRERTQRREAVAPRAEPRRRERARREDRPARRERDRDRDASRPATGGATGAGTAPPATPGPATGAQEPEPRGGGERDDGGDAAGSPPAEREARLAPGGEAAGSDGWSATPILLALALVAAAIAAVGALRVRSRARRAPRPVTGTRRPASRPPAQGATTAARPDRSPRLLPGREADAAAEREPAASRR